METHEQKQFIVNNLKRAREFKTNLVIGELGCRLFKEVYKGELHTITNAEQVREFKDIYFYESEDPLVFEDLSLLTPNIQASLLKFIEEPTRPVIVLCSQDNISEAMMSRFMNYVKIEEDLKSDFLSIESFINIKEEAEDKSMFDEGNDLDEKERLILKDIDKASLALCPEYWYWSTYIKLTRPDVYNPDVYIKLMFM